MGKLKGKKLKRRKGTTHPQSQIGKRMEEDPTLQNCSVIENNNFHNTVNNRVEIFSNLYLLDFKRTSRSAIQALIHIRSITPSVSLCNCHIMP